MGKKIRDKDGHTRENNQIEEGNAVKETDVLDVSKSSNIDGDKNKMEADNNGKKDCIKKRKAEFDTDKKVDQNAENGNGRKRKKSKSEKNDSEFETLEHSKMQEPVEVQKICSAEDIDKTVHGTEEAYEKRKKKKKKKQKLITDENGTGKENSAGNKIEHRKLGDVVGDAEDSNRCKKKKSKSVKNDSETKTLGHSKMQEPVEAQKIYSPEDISKTVHGKEVAYEKRKKKKEKKQNLEKLNGNVADGIAVTHSIVDENGTGKENSAGKGIECRKLGDIGGDAEEDGNRCKKKKSKSAENGSETKTPELSKMQEPVEAQKICSPEDINKKIHGKEEAYEKRKKKKEKKQKLENLNDNVVDEYGHDAEDGNECKKKKSKSVKNDSEGGHHKGDAGTKSVKTAEQVENATPKEKSKKVSFSNQVEVFPSTSDKDGAKRDGKEGLVFGKRYSKEEDEIVMNAVAEYIENHNLGEDGLNMVMNCKDYKEVRNCWKEIQASIPWRPVQSVYDRAHNLFERGDKHPWSPEELEMVRKFVKEHGPQWRLLGDSLGKHRRHVKDAWRRTKLENCNTGQWSQEEFQSLFDLVNLDLSMRVDEERISKHGMLRDNICWTAISDRMQTRRIDACCKKWYDKLTSPMVAEGVWADADDYHMLDALSSLDACCMEDVDWDNLLEHRSGDLCRKRWSQMVQHLGPNKDSSFPEQVEILANRYRPDMADARATFDSKIPVDLP